MSNRINVTRSFLPPIEEYNKLLERVWASRTLTNNGDLLIELEEKLLERLKCQHISMHCNGTLSIQFLLKSLRQKGEIITTPFSYVATTNSILWEGFTPIFADINSTNYCISVADIESKITSQTRAILATHVYGYPCDVEKLEALSKKYDIPVFYDAAHAFGVEIGGKSLLEFGAGSTLSFHATKLFHTVEGGAVISRNKELIEEINLYRSFGHKGEHFIGEGINGKMSEFHAAMGIVNLRYVDALIEERKRISERYDQEFIGLEMIRAKLAADIKYNYSYYAILLASESIREKLVMELNDDHIFPRKYFYPSLNQLPQVKYQPCPVSEDIASRILCLPLFNGMSEEELSRIITIVKKAME